MKLGNCKVKNLYGERKREGKGLEGEERAIEA